MGKPELDAWLSTVASSPLVDLQSEAFGVSEDKEAIFAGLTRDESNGPTEGHITRLKLIKRQGYGQASFDLLRLGVLSPRKKRKTTQDARAGTDHKRRKELKSLNSEHTTTGISEVA